VRTGTFIERPNRFVAYVDIDGVREKCHVKNTGRCAEILTPGSDLILEGPFAGRGTRYDVIAAYKNGVLVNIDSQAPNRVALESVNEVLGPVDVVKPEYTYGNSRIDLFAEQGGRKILMEVKGVTLERDGVAMFPDAPTERGLKHVRELASSPEDGFEPCILFLIQMSGVKCFTPNYETHREFGEALEEASGAGVRVLAYDCVVAEDSMTLGKPVDVRLGHS
jgi:sugar fermentation stimulation protein A